MIEQEELESIFATTYFEDFAESCENLPLDILGRLYNDRLERTVPNYEECLTDIEDLVYGVSERVVSSHQPLIVHAILERLEELSEMAVERAHGKCVTIDDIQECLEGKLGVLEVDRRNLLVRVSSHPTHGTDGGEGENEVVTSESPGADIVLPATPPKLPGRPTKQQRRSKRKSTPCPMRDFDLGPTLDFGRLDDNDASNSASGPTEHTDPRHHFGSLASSNHCGTVGASKVRRRNATGQKKKGRVISHSRRLSLGTAAEPKYCFCKQVSDGDMIACDNETCSIEWFHFTCLQLTSKPRGKWYCPMCRGARPNVMKTRDTQEPQCQEMQAS